MRRPNSDHCIYDLDSNCSSIEPFTWLAGLLNILTFLHSGCLNSVVAAAKG